MSLQLSDGSIYKSITNGIDTNGSTNLKSHSVNNTLYFKVDTANHIKFGFSFLYNFKTGTAVKSLNGNIFLQKVS